MTEQYPQLPANPLETKTSHGRAARLAARILHRSQAAPEATGPSARALEVLEHIKSCREGLKAEHLYSRPYVFPTRPTAEPTPAEAPAVLGFSDLAIAPEN